MYITYKFSAVMFWNKNCFDSLKLFELTCDPDDFSTVRDALEAKFGSAEDARLDWKPQTTVAVNESGAETLLKFLGVLEDNDDVQRVAANFDVDEDVLERLSAWI